MTTSTRPSPDLDRAARVETEEQAVERLKDSYWRRYDTKPEIREKVKGKDRVILLDITDGNSYTFYIEDGVLAAVEQTADPKATVRVSVTRADLFALYNGELKPLEAFMGKRVRVKAGFRDMLFAKSLIGF